MRARLVVIALGVVLVAACAPGTPDLGYSPGGAVPYGAAGAAAAGTTALVPTADGGVIATRGGARPLTRISANGVVDQAWGSTLPNNCLSTSGAVAAGTSVLFSCSHLPATGPQVWQVWRVTAGGVLDPTFGGGDGIADLPSTINEVEIAALPSGRYLGLGYQTVPASATSLVPLIAVVLSPTGAILSTTQIDIPLIPNQSPVTFLWHVGVRLVATPTGVAALERRSAVIPTNGIEDVWTRVQHFDVNGAIADTPEFVGPPINNDPRGGPAALYAIPGYTSLGDGRVATASRVLFADFQPFPTIVSFLQVIRADGSPDPGFGDAGIVRLTLADGSRLEPQTLVATNGGRYLVVAGASENGGAPLVARYDSHTGALDPTYGNGGRAGVVLAQVDVAAARAGIDQLYLGGTDSAGRPSVARIWNHLTP
jgi:hypothetical protein